jgi:hypothetical protein
VATVNGRSLRSEEPAPVSASPEELERLRRALSEIED